MRRVLFAAGVCFASFIASRLGAQDSAPFVSDSSVVSASLTAAPWGSRDIVRAVRSNLREHAIPSALQNTAEEGRSSSAVKRGAWIGAGIGFTAGLYSALTLAYNSTGCKVSSDCDRSHAQTYAYVGAVTVVDAGVGAFLGAVVGKVVQLTVSHPPGQP
jgi:hypothetical protein